MINFEDELKKFHPSMEFDEAEDMLYDQFGQDDLAGVLVDIVKEAKEERQE